MENLPSLLLENAVDELSKLPGVGKRTALRFALHLLKQSEIEVDALSTSLTRLRNEIKYCVKCNSISDTETCAICANPRRNPAIICVVENIRDVMAIENTLQFNGLYHVLGGVISPIEGIGINDLHIDSLLKRVQEENIEEIILALPTTMEGDTTNFYINKQLIPFNIKVSAIARGVAIGDNLEFADEITLGRSILNRTPFDNIYSSKS